MPLYEYKCIGEAHQFEELRPFSERDNPLACPECGNPSFPFMSTCNHTFGWRLADSSHVKGNPDEVERDI